MFRGIQKYLAYLIVWEVDCECFGSHDFLKIAMLTDQLQGGLCTYAGNLVVVVGTYKNGNVYELLSGYLQQLLVHVEVYYLRADGLVCPGSAASSSSRDG